jgi:pimeloyl-ACP methyl ester carboxylesterase
MATVTTKDDTQIYNKDWGSGPPVVFSHGWPLSADAWEAQMMFLADKGYRTIGHDRRGHGRSSQPWHGNEMDTYADDLAALIKAPRPQRRDPRRPLDRRRRGHPLHRPPRHEARRRRCWSAPCRRSY